MTGLSILLVDDHPVVREGYRRLLERQPSFRGCAEAEDARSAYAAYKANQPDVVIMDIAMPGASGVEAVRHIRDWDKNARILIFSMHLSAAMTLKAFEAGASGFVTKSSGPAELIRAVSSVAAGGRALSPDVSEVVAADRLTSSTQILADLSPRETEILRLLARGMESEEIAGLLHLSPKTVRNHHYAIKAKIGARNDAQLVWLALGAGLVEVEAVKPPGLTGR
jgi:two-component system, NarL family, invasion response regulator UvrY